MKKMIGTWCGVPLSELPREDLEQALIGTHAELMKASAENCRLSVQNVRLMADLARERQASWFTKLARHAFS